MNTHDLWALLVRYGAGRTTPAETEQLRQRCASIPGSAELPREVERLVEVSRRVLLEDETQDAWQRLERRLAPAPRRWRRWAVMAAALAILVGGGLVVRQQRVSSPRFREITNPGAQQMQLDLPDGSRMVLGPKSAVRYATTGFARARSLSLRGEGFFTVARDSAHPFVVRTASMTAQALGTTFGVRAYQKDAVAQVVVTEGKVLLHANNDSANSRVVLDRNSRGAVDQRGGTAMLVLSVPNQDSASTYRHLDSFLDVKLVHALLDTLAHHRALDSVSHPSRHDGRMLCARVETHYLCTIDGDTTQLFFDMGALHLSPSTP